MKTSNERLLLLGLFFLCTFVCKRASSETNNVEDRILVSDIPIKYEVEVIGFSSSFPIDYRTFVKTGSVTTCRSIGPVSSPPPVIQIYHEDIPKEDSPWRAVGREVHFLMPKDAKGILLGHIFIISSESSKIKDVELVPAQQPPLKDNEEDAPKQPSQESSTETPEATKKETAKDRGNDDPVPPPDAPAKDANDRDKEKQPPPPSK